MRVDAANRLATGLLASLLAASLWCGSFPCRADAGDAAPPPDTLLTVGATWSASFDSGSWRLTLKPLNGKQAQAHVELQGPDRVVIIYFTQFLPAGDEGFVYDFDARNPDGFWPARSIIVRCTTGQLELAFSPL